MYYNNLLFKRGAPTRGWLRLQAPTLSINLTKQGYCLILVPATGTDWSTVWSTIARGRVPAHPLAIPYIALT